MRVTYTDQKAYEWETVAAQEQLRATDKSLNLSLRMRMRQQGGYQLRKTFPSSQMGQGISSGFVIPISLA